jgi:hypothetical protein
LEKLLKGVSERAQCDCRSATTRIKTCAPIEITKGQKMPEKAQCDCQVH